MLAIVEKGLDYTDTAGLVERARKAQAWIQFAT
jgi:hypothetical protein